MSGNNKKKKKEKKKFKIQWNTPCMKVGMDLCKYTHSLICISSSSQTRRFIFHDWGHISIGSNYSREKGHYLQLE